MWACYGGNYDIVKLLVQHNEDSVSIKSENVGSIRLYVSIHLSTSSLFLLLIEKLDSSDHCCVQKLLENCKLPSEARSRS